MSAAPGGVLHHLHFFVLLALWSPGYASYYGQLGKTCRTPILQDGICVSVYACEPYRDLLAKRPLSPTTNTFLRESQCGVMDEIPYVCCPTCWSFQPQVPGSVNPPGSGQSGYGGVGQPAAPTKAPITTTTTRRPDPPVTFKAPEIPLVPNIQTPGDDDDLSNHPNWRYLPTTCGSQLEQLVFGGNETKRDSHAWLALLYYQTTFGYGFRCGGTLISSRYVLTAAHCVRGIRDATLEFVRLGEHDLNTDPDCSLSEGDCSQPVQNISVVEIISHSKFRPYSRNKYHDIALLRLEREATFGNSVKAICIPRPADINKLYENTKLTVAGWGRTETETLSSVKRSLEVPVVSNSVCKVTYQDQLSLGRRQMCAGGEAGKDACDGDSGGPLMTVAQFSEGPPKWVIAGVVSIGTVNCSLEGMPGIYTRVGPYVKWILDNIKP